MGVLPLICVGFRQALYTLLQTGGEKGVRLKGREARGGGVNTGEEQSPLSIN